MQQNTEEDLLHSEKQPVEKRFSNWTTNPNIKPYKSPDNNQFENVWQDFYNGYQLPVHFDRV